jgi:hypothetical protein
MTTFYGILRHFRQYSNYIVAVSFMVEETGVPGENHRPSACRCQTLSHSVAWSMPHHERGSNSQL